MELKIIPSPLYKDSNGIPAYKSGEWPGIKPNHFERTRLMIKQLRKKLDYERKSSSRYIPEKRSNEYMFKPSLKLVKSYLENVRKQHQIDKGRKHEFDCLNKISDTYDNNLFFTRNRKLEKIKSSSLILPKLKKEIKTRNLVLYRSLSELNVEKAMTRKKRINSLEQQRNYYSIVNPGDKNYRYAECSENFFKEGGLIPGSTNILRYSENYNQIKNNIYEHMDLNVRSLDTDKIWNNKLERERKEREMRYVLNLENWDTRNVNFNEVNKKNENDKNNQSDTQRKNQKK
jgi:hypothetical protein